MQTSILIHCSLPLFDSKKQAFLGWDSSHLFWMFAFNVNESHLGGQSRRDRNKQVWATYENKGKNGERSAHTQTIRGLRDTEGYKDGEL